MSSQLKSFEGQEHGEAADMQAGGSWIKTYIKSDRAVIEGADKLFAIGALCNQTSPLEVFD
jgi:hypothetical protein